MVDRTLETDIRLSILEIVAADLVARLIPDEHTLKAWTDRQSERAQQIAEKRGNTEVSTAYTAAWDEFLSTVRVAHAGLRDRPIG